MLAGLPYMCYAQLPMFDANLKRAPHLMTKGELADSMGIMGVTGILTRVQGAMVIEYFETNTGAFLGFAGDTTQFDWRKMKLFRRVPVMRRLVKDYGPVRTLEIYRGKLVPGLSERDIFEIKGRADKVSRKDGAEMWIYGSDTLIFRKNKLEGIQDANAPRT